MYDVTWSTGSKEYDYTSFSKWLLKVEDKYKRVYKQKKLRKKKFAKSPNECKDLEIEIGPNYKLKPKLKNELIRWFLQHFKLRVKEKYIYKINYDYYLTQPNLFAITHWPDDATWSLLDTRTIRLFENDSAFYFLNKDTYKKQSSEGVECAKCDSIFELGEMQKQFQMLAANSINNSKNPFINTEAYLQLSRLSSEKISE